MQLIIWDLDDTLFTSQSLVGLRDKDNQLVGHLTPHEWATYKLPEGYKFDYYQFNSAEVFENTCEPIRQTMKVFTGQQLLAKQTDQFDMIILTGRDKFDDIERFKQVLGKYGIDTDYVTVILAGAEKLETVGDDKRAALTRYLNSKNYQYDSVLMYDDAQSNLLAIGKLLKERDSYASYWPYLVTKSGDILPD